MSTPSKEFLSPPTLMPPAGYSHIAKVKRGTIVYLAGQVASDASGKLVGEGNFEAQAEQVFRNLKIAIEAAGGTMADIVKLNIYLVAEVDPAALGLPFHEAAFASGPHLEREAADLVRPHHLDGSPGGDVGDGAGHADCHRRQERPPRDPRARQARPFRRPPRRRPQGGL